MEKNPGGQKFWQRGEGRFREILSCPPQNAFSPQMPPPPQIPRPGAANGFNYTSGHHTRLLSWEARVQALVGPLLKVLK